MPKAGSYEYPRFDVDFVLDKLRKFHEMLKEDEATRQVLAETLGMASKGGAFAHLVASMEKYGLVETGGGKIVLTDLGKTCLYGDDSEREAAVAKSVASVGLFREIYSLHGPEAREDSIRAFLRQKAQLDPAEAQQIVPQVYKVYRKVARYLSLRQNGEQTLEEPGRPQPVVGIPKESPGNSKTQTLKIQFGDLYIQVPPNDEQAISLAIQALQLMRDRKIPSEIQSAAKSG
jgi:hypothetical protein